MPAQSIKPSSVTRREKLNYHPSHWQSVKMFTNLENINLYIALIGKKQKKKKKIFKMYRNKVRRFPKKDLYCKHSLLTQKSLFFGLYAENINKVRMRSVFTDPLIENFSNFERSLHSYNLLPYFSIVFV